MVARIISSSALLLTVLAAAITPERKPYQPRGNGSKLLTYNETTPVSTLSPSSKSFNWIDGGVDGEYVVESESKGLLLVNPITNQNSTFIDAADVPANHYDFAISVDLQYILWATNHTKQYRWSYFADYVLQDVVTLEQRPIDTGVLYAELSPRSDAVAYVKGNNLFVYNITADATKQITNDGGPDLFHGVQDWVYEEEVVSGIRALWWSPDGDALVFQTLNETGVPVYSVPYYTAPIGNEKEPGYPRELDLRYPKVGATHPQVSLSLLTMLDLRRTPVAVDTFASNDTILFEVAWLCQNHEAFAYKAMNRDQDKEHTVLVDTATLKSRTIRSRSEAEGWIDGSQSMQYLGQVPVDFDHTSNQAFRTGTQVVLQNSAEFYLDLSDHSGWNHIYLFPTHGGQPIPLTSGEWEVVSVVGVDRKRSLVYYLSKEHSSIDQHLYSVSYTTKNKTALVDDSCAGYWSASFSSDFGYHLLSYQGPDVPYQELRSSASLKTIQTVTTNADLYDRLQAYTLPRINYFELQHPDGFMLNVLERLPANFSSDKQYPVLFNPYGGPGSQSVNTQFKSLNWGAFIASDPELEFITYIVDNRGTGFKGHAFRAAVTRHLGGLEAQDQIWAAKQLAAQKQYIDASKIGMWGWSFGGYLTSKTIEANDGTFSFGLITAPVSDWRFYDSVYTERYMKQLSENAAGYNQSAVHNTTGFKEIAGGFAIMHGTGDDNVHYQNTAVFVDKLVGDGVPPSQMKMMAFTDSAHSIQYNHAPEYLYKFLTERLWDEKQRSGDKATHQWTRKDLGSVV